MKSSHPKVCFEMLGKPLVRWVVDAARAAGCEDVVCVLGHGREEVGPIVFDCEVVIQSERLGTGHAVMMSAPRLEDAHGPVVVLSGDCPMIRPETISALLDAQASSRASAVVLTSIADDPTGYGRVIRDESGSVARIVEQRDCTSEEAEVVEVNSGMYCFDSDALLGCLDRLGNDNSQGEYYLTDVISLMVADGMQVGAIVAEDPAECLGINDRWQLAEAQAQMQRRINSRLMLAGVTMIAPDLVWVGPDVEVGTDVELWPMTFLLGETKVGSDTRIGPNARVVDAVVGSGCVIDESIVLKSTIDDDVSCGPRAYIRPGTRMCKGAKAGTHVEIKHSTVGPGSKVPHLSYIGDATIGADVNIGAGSITCNYDGRSKHATTIGDGTFIGSDTMMVAPVNIGRGCTTGAGSTIDHDIPDGALGIARSRQRNVEGWAERSKR